VDEEGRRDVIVKEDAVRLGENLFHFESDKIVTIFDLLKSEEKDLYLYLFEHYSRKNPWIAEMVLAAYLASEYRKSNSRIASYLESLPSRKPSNSGTYGLLFYSKNVSQRLLYGSSTQNTLIKVHNFIEEIFEVLRETHLFLNKTPKLTLEEFQYAVGTVLENAFEVNYKKYSDDTMIALLPGFDALRHDSGVLPHEVTVRDDGNIVVRSMSTFLKGQPVLNNYFGSKDEMMPSLDEAVLRHGIDVLKWMKPRRVSCIHTSSGKTICRNGTSIENCESLENKLDDLDSALLFPQTFGLSSYLHSKRMDLLDAERDILQSAYTNACENVRHFEVKHDDITKTTTTTTTTYRDTLLEFVTKNVFLLNQKTLQIVAHVLDNEDILTQNHDDDIRKSLKYEINAERRRRILNSRSWHYNQNCKSEINIQAQTFPTFNVFHDLKPISYDMLLKDISDKSSLQVSPSGRWIWIRREVPKNVPIPLPLCDTSEQRASIMFCDDTNDDEISLSIPMLYERENDNLMLWMSLSPMELMSQHPLIVQARGRVVVAGLGMGYMLTQIRMRQEVTEVVLIERSEELIAWILPYLEKNIMSRKKDCPLHVIAGDVYDELPRVRDKFGGEKFDIAIVDTFAVFDSKRENRAAIELLQSSSKDSVRKVIGWAT